MNRFTIPLLFALLSAAGCGTKAPPQIQCSPACAAGQTCDTTTGTCSGPITCTPACAANQTCDSATGTCKTNVKQCAQDCSKTGQTCDTTVGTCTGPVMCVPACTAGQICDTNAVACIEPPVPALGTQIDRMGRAAVNTALTNPFELFVQGETSDQTKDKYNADSDIANWGKTWGSAANRSYIYANLAAFDGIDGTCGNQFGAGANAVLGRYDTLAGVLADDELYLNTASGTCADAGLGKGYLAVEVAAVMKVAPTTCGGRTPLYNTIDQTFQALTGSVALVNGVLKDADGTASLTTFPFLADPNP